jgi:pyrrolidone-carboxylate peptidase
MFMAVVKRIWIVILAAIIVGAGAFMYFKNTYVPVYQTKVGLYIIGNKQDPAAATSVQIATNIAKDYELLIKDPVVLDKVSAAIKEKGIASRLSYSAGAFVCNDVLYTLLHRYDRSDTLVGFVHVPFLPEQAKEGVPSMPLETIIEAIKTAIEVI